MIRTILIEIICLKRVRTRINRRVIRTKITIRKRKNQKRTYQDKKVNHPIVKSRIPQLLFMTIIRNIWTWTTIYGKNRSTLPNTNQKQVLHGKSSIRLLISC